MNKNLFLLGLVALFLFLLTSHLLLKFLPAPRTWLQRNIVIIDYETHEIFESVLGEHYIVTPDKFYYPGENPYYYTHFDALYYWFYLADYSSFRACSQSSELCIPGVHYRSESYSEEFFYYHLKNIESNQETKFTYYCVGGIDAIGEENPFQGFDATHYSGKWFSIHTRKGSYTFNGIGDEQKKQWIGRCEKG